MTIAKHTIVSLSKLCLWLFALIFCAVSTASAGEKLKIIVGGDHQNPPYEFLENGKPTGFNVELMSAVAQATGMEVEFRLGPWKEVREELEKGQIDALAGMYYSTGRDNLFDFSVPHTMVSAGLFVRQDSPIRSFDDIKGKVKIVQKGDIIDDYLRETGITYSIVAVTDPKDELMLLASGKHDCALMPSRFQGEYLKRSLGLTNIRAIEVNLPQFRYCFAVQKGNDALRARLDEGLNILKVNGRYKEIYEKWFGVYEERSLWLTVRYFVWGLALVATLLAASIVWSWALRRQVRKRTAELRESEKKFRVLAETSPTGIWLYQGDRIVYVNPAALSILGYTEEECLEMRLWDWVHPDFRDLVREREIARQRNEPVPTHYECKHLTKGGIEKWALISVGLIDYRGKPAGIATMFDISERKQMEEELLHAYDNLEKRVKERTAELAETVGALEKEIKVRSQAEEALQRKRLLLEELNRTLEVRVREEVARSREKDIMLIQQNRQAALGEMLDHIAHQWKQPLNTISLITYLLKDNETLQLEEVIETADNILDQVEHMSQTLEVFRNFYRPDKEKSDFLVKKEIEKAISFIMQALMVENVNVEIEADPAITAFGYPKEFIQVILNLVNNARDAFRDRSSEKQMLVIKAFEENSMAIVTITDNAGGICKENIASIFDLNFTTKEMSGGSGVGLYMSKYIIERHMGGNLSAGNVDDGACFTIKLPVSAQVN